MTLCIDRHVKYPLLVCDFKEIIFFDRFPKNRQMSNLMKIRPLGAELFYADGGTDGQKCRS